MEKERSKLPKIKFTNFQEWYLLNSRRYVLKNKTVLRIEVGEFRFDTIDTIRYRIWKNKEHCRRVKEKSRRAKEENVEQVRLLLSYVKHDIEAYENETRKELE